MSRAARQAFMTARRDVSPCDILEIGALDTPTWPEFDCRYLDWFSGDELREALARNTRRQADRVVDPHYVVKDKLFAGGVDRQFDVVIANHVIEHIADPIRWLEQVALITRPSGNLFLAVPDRRYTFDYLRPVSTVAELIRGYVEDLRQPSRWQALDALFYYRPVRAEDLWAGDCAEKLNRRPYPLDDAIRRAGAADDEYLDVHCGVFTTFSFAELIEDLASVGLVEWRIEAISDVERGSDEFYVWMARSDRPRAA
jgi:SAM-dependent methyltransferase